MVSRSLKTPVLKGIEVYLALKAFPLYQGTVLNTSVAAFPLLPWHRFGNVLFHSVLHQKLRADPKCNLFPTDLPVARQNGLEKAQNSLSHAA